MTTMQIDRAVVEQALEALEYAQQDRECPSTTRQAITALRAALAQQKDPTDPGNDVDVLREHVRHLERRVRELHAQQAEPLNLRDPAVQKRLATQWGYVPAAQAEPVARECSDPMCACRGGPCAECEEGEREKEIEDLRSSLYFYQRRCEALQSWQSKMRDPERTIVCDILANGKTLDPAVAGNRYTTPQQAEPVEPVDVGLLEYRGNSVAFIYQKMTAYRAGIDAAWDALRAKGLHPDGKTSLANMIAKYTAPPQRQPLTEKEMYIVEEEARKNFRLSQAGPRGQMITYWDSLTPWLIRAVERAHGIKE